MIITFLIFLLIILGYFKFNIYHHIVTFISPWLLIILFGGWEISNLHKKFELMTYIVILLFILSYLVGSRFVSNKKVFNLKNVNNIAVKKKLFYAIILIYIVLSLLNILLAGYIPLVRMITIGDSGYMDFGISGLYGFYNAFANALGVFSYYLYLKTGERKYLFLTFLVITFFILFVTRQNIISLLVEVFVVYGYVKSYVKAYKIIIFLVIFLFLFSIIGDSRSGDIRVIVEAKDEYLSLPSIIFWIYGYFYMSGVNLNNSINFTEAPYFDGSSFSTLLPNIFKKFIGLTYEYDSFLEKLNFNVSTAVQQLYNDFGLYEVIGLGFIFGFLTQKYYIRALTERNYQNIAIYGVLLFCATFSFFINFWFFLPIIFQIPFILLFSNLILTKQYKKTL